MGCGTSKAAEIDGNSITIKASPKKNGSLQTKEDPVSGHITNGTNADRITAETECDNNAATASVSKYPPPVAFDVPLNDDGSPMERKKSLPRKLKKISIPVTKEQLDDKQRAVLERKEQELKKRKESCNGRRASRIRREIMDARLNEGENDVSLSVNETRRQLDDESLTGNIEVDNTYNSAINEEDIWDDQEAA